MLMDDIWSIIKFETFYLIIADFLIYLMEFVFLYLFNIKRWSNRKKGFNNFNKKTFISR
jgi:hypothetical protein